MDHILKVSPSKFDASTCAKSILIIKDLIILYGKNIRSSMRWNNPETLQYAA